MKNVLTRNKFVSIFMRMWLGSLRNCSETFILDVSFCLVTNNKSFVIQFQVVADDKSGKNAWGCIEREVQGREN
jgi:hypothetical protein